MHKLFTARSGFTLVELAVVITVIGLIATIGVFSYQAYLKNAQNAQTASTAGAYTDAVGSTLAEKKEFQFDGRYGSSKACINADSPATTCCYFVYVSGSSKFFSCTNNQLQDDRAAAGYASEKGTTIANVVKSYFKDSLPLLPKPHPSSGGCTTSSAESVTSTTANTTPCTSQVVTLTWFVGMDGKSKAYIHYFVPMDSSCGVKNVATVQDGYDPNVPIAPKTVFEGAQYTDRKTTGSPTYTFCMVSVI